MCPCDGRYVCPGHTAMIGSLYRELCDLEAREQQLGVAGYERLRQVRAALLGHGPKAEIVIHQIRTREREEARAATDMASVITTPSSTA